MLRLTIHSGPLASVSHFNRTDWVDIAYEHLGPMADYKVVLFAVGDGATEPLYLRQYPRWSASLWDLALRAIALGLSPDTGRPVEAVHAFEPGDARPAFAECVSGVLSHVPPSGAATRELATIEIKRNGRRRGAYVATLREDLAKATRSACFEFLPKRLRPAELVMHAALHALTGTDEVMPARPALRLPVVRVIAGAKCIEAHKIAEPARTGLLRWLHSRNEKVLQHDGCPEGLVPEASFLRFLESAI